MCGLLDEAKVIELLLFCFNAVFWVLDSKPLSVGSIRSLLFLIFYLMQTEIINLVKFLTSLTKFNNPVDQNLMKKEQQKKPQWK